MAAAGAWLTQAGSGPTAVKRLVRVIEAIDGLADHPCRYPVGAHPPIRERFCAGGYRILYELTPDTGRNESAGDIEILRIFGPGQNRNTFRS